MIGVHTPGYSFGRDRDTVARAVERLEIAYPVLLDPDLAGLAASTATAAGRAATCSTARGKLRFIHYGEGEYQDTELAIGEVPRDDSTSEPLEPLRPEDAPGVLLEPQTADIVLPADRDRLELVRDWTDGEDWIAAADAGAAASFAFSAGAAFAVLSGDDDGARALRGGRDGRRRSRPALRLHGVQFTPVPPAPS